MIGLCCRLVRSRRSDMDLTFICSVRNGQSFVDECLGSVISCYPHAAVIVIDDASTDGTFERLEKYSNRYSNILVQKGHKSGRAQCLNQALSLVSTKYVSNIDIDDIVFPGRERLISFLEQCGDAAVCAGKSIAFTDCLPLMSDLEGECEDLHEVTGRLFMGNQISHIASVVRVDAIRSVRGYNESRHAQFDYDLWVRLADAGYRLFKCSVTVAGKRIHKAQSFERTKHLRYVISSVFVQYRAAGTFHERTTVLFIAFSRILWAVVPRRVRRMLYLRG